MAADPLTSRTVGDLLFEDADFDMDEDPFADPPAKGTERDDKPTLSPRKRKADAEDIFGQNIDEEIKITKQRKKIPKLDAERLLSEPGVPKIRTLMRSGQFKKKLRLKGKGHEFNDAAKLLNFYQLWLDNLYPRAKFADAIQLVEKAGHTKKMQMYRKSWMDEGKPGYVRREEIERAVEDQQNRNKDTPEVQQKGAEKNVSPPEEDPASLFFWGNDDEDAGAGGPDDDELDALLAQDTTASHAPTKSTHADIESEGEDDLDALLAQDTSRKLQSLPETNGQDDLDALLNTQQGETSKDQTRSPTKEPTQTEEADEGDDLDALLDTQTFQEPATTTQIPQQKGDLVQDFSDSDLDDLDALLSNQQATKEPELPSPPSALKPTETKPPNATDITPGSEEVPELDNVISSSPIPNVRTDELDQLMDEHDATVNRKNADTQLVEEFMSSSPIPNRDSQ